ncbi:MAG: hypothetical protein ACREVA_13350, partial [Burkholderiales bacterium]
YMAKLKPIHPGEILIEEFLKPTSPHTLHVGIQGHLCPESLITAAFLLLNGIDSRQCNKLI